MINLLLDIATGASATTKRWKNERVKWSSLVKRLKKPTVTPESYARFMAMSKDEQSKTKDVGGFVGGFLVGGRRKPQSVQHRQLLTLDMDFAGADTFDTLSILLMGTEFILHGTHKHSSECHRYRLIVPLDREVDPTEYEAVARLLAADFDIAAFDPTTFQPERLMFWPSVSSDIPYYFEMEEGQPLTVDYYLNRYTDYTDSSSWPTVRDEYAKMGARAAKQQDPTEKAGLIGAFCRTYSVSEAIARYLSEVYEPTAHDDRYTYLEGSTSAGLVVYDDLYAYSHHGTDPIGGLLCNAYDLVRIHKFGHLDAADSTAKSVKEMEALITSDPNVVGTLSDERISSAKFDFAEEPDTDMLSFLDEDDEPSPTVAVKVDEGWKRKLDIDKNGNFLASSSNLNAILKNDENVNKLFALNLFDSQRYLIASAPWRTIKAPEPLKDVDYSGLRNYIDSVYQISNTGKVEDALALVLDRNAYHPIRNYLNALPEWDGIPRVDTLLHDFLGAEDNLYTREAMRKTMVGAVARVFNPGVKFDYALVLVGKGVEQENQGTGKSTFIKKLAKMKWYSDSFSTVQGKEAYEQLQGAWLIEIGELSAFKKSEVEQVKLFVSKGFDKYRPAYGKTVQDFKRQCVFIGTTNESTFLQDSSGNRRFNPVDVYPNRAAKSVLWSNELDSIVDQLWSEALHLYRSGEALYLSAEATEKAVSAQFDHFNLDDRRGLVEEYLNVLLPKGWDKMDILQRRMYLDSDEEIADEGVEARRYVCTAEIWCECLRMDRASLNARNTRELNDIMRTIRGWEAKSSTRSFRGYGGQRYYERKL